MNRYAPTMGSLALRTFLWLPPCFVAWHFAAPFLGSAAARVAVALVNLFRPHLVTALEQQGSALAFVTSLEVYPQPGVTGVLVLEVNHLVYVAGLPLFLALMLASRARWWKLLLGAVLLLPFQAWGMAFDFLAQLVKGGPELAGRAGIVAWRAEGIALSYQLGSLIFPALAPVALWMAFNRPLVADLVRRRVAPVPAEAIAAVK